MYGKILHSKNYKLEIVLPYRKQLGHHSLTIYSSQKKPLIRNLYFLSLFCLWIYLFMALIGALWAIILIIAELLGIGYLINYFNDYKGGALMLIGKLMAFLIYAIGLKTLICLFV